MIVNDLIIDKMRTEDISVIAAAEKRHFSTPWTERELQAHLDGETTVFWVARLGETVVGYLGRNHSFETMDILTICVLEDYRRAGIGRALLSFLEQEAAEKCVQRILLEVRPSNNKAKSLYEQFGYTLLHVRKKYYTDPVEDALIMQKEIEH